MHLSSGTLRLLPIPSAADAVVLYVPARFTVYTAGTDNVLLPDYDEAIRTNLAIRFRGELSSMGARMDPEVWADVKLRASTSKGDIQRSNRQIPRARSDWPESRGGLTQGEFESGAFLRW